MHTDAAEAAALVNGVMAWRREHPSAVEVIVAPPFPFLADAVQRTAAGKADGAGTTVLVAAQNCHEEEHGAFTGEVGVPMLKSLGVQACLVGHSERRQYFGETDAAVARKVSMLLKHGLLPIYCCGERLDERQDGRHQTVVAEQITTALGHLSAAEWPRVVVAYEPVWAIGTGVTATPEQAQEMHAFIRSVLRRMAGEAAGGVPILYGGSCKPGNAEGLFNGADINGGLIGGAALSVGDFTDLVRIARQVKCPA